jgi:hypothetical protein
MLPVSSDHIDLLFSWNHNEKEFPYFVQSVFDSLYICALC